MKSIVFAVTAGRAVVVSPIHNVDYPMAAVVKVLSGGNTVYLGGPDVTIANGFPLQALESLSWDEVNEEMYAVAASTATLYILRRAL